MKALNAFWAFDPYSDILSSSRVVADVISGLAKKTGVEVAPVYFMNERILNWVGNITPAQVEPMIPIARKVMDSKLADFTSFPLQPSEVCYVGSGSQKNVAESVDQFLREKKADVLFLATHARGGMARAFLGSFAESLLLKTKVPIFLVSPKTQGVGELKTVFYPTDLSEESYRAFLLFLKSKFAEGTHINLYSKITSPSEVLAQSTTQFLGGGWVSISHFLEERSTELEKRAQKWREEAVRAGCSLDILVDGADGALEERILTMARETNSDFIAMPSFATGADVWLVGSRSREIIRNSELPVLVQHFEK